MKKNKVLIAGGTGLVGSFLSNLLINSGFEIGILTRNVDKKSKYPLVYWNPMKGEIDEDKLNDYSIIINLAGAGIADKRWTSDRKKLIIESRVEGNALLNMTFKKLNWRPNLYVSASAIGFYGDRGAEILDEDSSNGKGFLAETTKIWEEAIALVEARRKVVFRIGIVLSNQGGALPQMVLPTKFGMGNYFGDGSQFTSWIHIEDLCQQILFAITNENINGIYNSVAPNPISQKEWIQSILKVYDKTRLLLPVPSFAIKLALGEMAAVVLEGAKVSSQKIENMGYKFLYPTIKEALEDIKERNV